MRKVSSTVIWLIHCDYSTMPWIHYGLVRKRLSKNNNISHKIHNVFDCNKKLPNKSLSQLSVNNQPILGKAFHL